MSVTVVPVVQGYQPITSESRVRDFEIPSFLSLGGTLVKVPKALKKKDIHYILDTTGKPMRVAWIDKGLGHLLNYHRLDKDSTGKLGCLIRSLEEIEKSISSLIKNDVLKDRHGPGFMCFVQSNENVPEDSILLSERSWSELVQFNPKWEKTGTVAITRYPNLGPSTTTELKILVNREADLFRKPTTPYSIANIAYGEGLAALLAEFDENIEPSDIPLGVFDAAYLHPNVLKGKLEGDADGDLIFGLAHKRGKPMSDKIRLVRKSKPIEEIKNDKGIPIVDVLKKKSDRTTRGPIEEWLPDLFDDLPIAQATYAIHLMVRNRLPKHRNAKHPMHEAWMEISPRALKIAEFVFDIRKGDWTPEEVQSQMDFIESMNREIRELQDAGDPFCCTITSQSVVNVQGFLEQFPDIQTYLDKVTGQNQGTSLKISSLLTPEKQ